MTQQAQPVLAGPDMTQADVAALRRAAQSLEHPSLAARLTNMVGRPIELIGYALPASLIEHFQDVARGHFTVRRLERAYGKELVRREYERLAQVK
jgi:hypothetical protein